MAAPKVKFEIDLVEVFENQFSNKPRPVRDQLRPILSNEAFTRMLGYNYIEQIVKRTLSGIDKDGQKFPAYSEAYKESDDFKIYGKSKKVNLRLSGEMLASMELGTAKARKIKNIMADNHNNDKAHGHITGNISNDPESARRNFLGLPMDDLGDIMKKTMAEFNQDSIENDLNSGDLVT